MILIDSNVIIYSDKYNISTTIVKDADVGGYTSRRRAIMIGSKIGNISLPNLKLLPYKTVKEALDKVNESWFNYTDVTQANERTKRKMNFVRPGHNFMDIPDELRDRGTHSNHYRRLHWNEISPALPNWRKCLLLHPEQNRILTVAEAAALSGLDETVRFLGPLNSRQQQVGNGVPYAIANLIKNTVKKALAGWRPVLAG